MTKFQCYRCRNLVELIPYCSECDLALPNSCKVGNNISKIEVEIKVARKKIKITNLCEDYFNVAPIFIGFANGCHSIYLGDTCEVVYKKTERIFYVNKVNRKRFADSDDDLINDFENKKASSIIRIIHSGINKKKAKANGYSKHRLDVYQRDCFKCLKCGTKNSLTLDHIHPKSKGGGNHVDNLQTLCKKCNGIKGATYADYRTDTKTFEENEKQLMNF